jgi:hypothetical protein
MGAANHGSRQKSIVTVVVHTQRLVGHVGRDSLEGRVHFLDNRRDARIQKNRFACFESCFVVKSYDQAGGLDDDLYRIVWPKVTRACKAREGRAVGWRP